MGCRSAIALPATPFATTARATTWNGGPLRARSSALDAEARGARLGPVPGGVGGARPDSVAAGLELALGELPAEGLAVGAGGARLLERADRGETAAAFALDRDGHLGAFGQPEAHRAAALAPRRLRGQLRDDRRGRVLGGGCRADRQRGC